MKLKVFTAFSGYDSQCMALDRLGIDYELVGWSEIDKYAIMAHNAIYPQYKERNFGDISKIDWENVPDFDLFTYSFPCTDISSAGQQKGLEEGSGTRSGLLWECKKAIELKRPKYLLMENVKALTQKKFLPYLHKWHLFLTEMGYTNFTQILNAKNFGVPQNRERVFMVSILGDAWFTFPKPFSSNIRLKDILEKDVDKRYYKSDKINNRILIEQNVIEPNVLTPKRTEYGKAIRKEYEKGSIKESRHNMTKLVPRTDGISNILTTIKKDYLLIEPIILHKVQEVAEKLRLYAEIMRGNGCGVTINKDLSLRPYKNDKSKSGISELQTDYDDSIGSTLISARPNLVYGCSTDFKIREYTPRECFRLMGVSDENIDKIQSAVISKNKQCYMAGNSIVVDVLYYIFKNLFNL